jgi:hypothetical protein
MYRHYFPTMALQAIRDGMEPRGAQSASDRFELAGDVTERT